VMIPFSPPRRIYFERFPGIEPMDLLKLTANSQMPTADR
jgi:hypothetical protein